MCVQCEYPVTAFFCVGVNVVEPNNCCISNCCVCTSSLSCFGERSRAVAVAAVHCNGQRVTLIQHQQPVAGAETVAKPAKPSVPDYLQALGQPQWITCDIRTFDMSVLGKFGVIMADPPWEIHQDLPYGTMADDEMRKMNIKVLQDDGVIFLWVTGVHVTFASLFAMAVQACFHCLCSIGHRPVIP